MQSPLPRGHSCLGTIVTPMSIHIQVAPTARTKAMAGHRLHRLPSNAENCPCGVALRERRRGGPSSQMHGAHARPTCSQDDANSRWHACCTPGLSAFRAFVHLFRCDACRHTGLANHGRRKLLQLPMAQWMRRTVVRPIESLLHLANYPLGCRSPACCMKRSTSSGCKLSVNTWASAGPCRLVVRHCSLRRL